MELKAVAYILSAYPDFHETFVAREIEAMRQRGVALRVYSLKPPPPAGSYLYPAHAEFVHYPPFILSWNVALRALWTTVRSPLQVARALAWLTRVYWTRPREFAKALCIVPKSLAIASELAGTDFAIHSHWATIPTTAAVLINIVTRKPFSFTAHAWDIYLTGADELAEKVRLSRGVATCTGYNVTHLRSIVPREQQLKIELNYHGLDFLAVPTAGRRPAEATGLRLLAVGRFVEQKGFSHLIRAVAQCVHDGRTVILAIVGDGPLETNLRELVEALGISGHVTFVGRLAHAATLELMSNSDVLVAPSVIAGNGDRDGIPNVVLEAMASRLPIVGSDVSGIPEVVRDGDTGYLVPPADVAALAGALRRLHDNPELGRSMGRNGRVLAEQSFRIEKNVADFLGLLSKFHAADPANPK